MHIFGEGNTRTTRCSSLNI
ncbi:MAG: hypothetical protein ACLS5Z_04630 [Clostridium fessum]